MEVLDKKIITISGEPLSGKTTLKSKLQQIYTDCGYDVKTISVSDMFEKCARAEGMPRESFCKEAETRQEFDKKIDKKIKEYGEYIIKKGEDNSVYIFDSRMAGKFVPEAFSVRLTVIPKIAAERVSLDNTNEHEHKFNCLESAIKSVEERKQNEKARYKEIYGIELDDEDNYDLVIDTSLTEPQEVARIIFECEERYNLGKPFPKFWRTYKAFLPTKDVGANSSCYEEIMKNIDINGLNLDNPICAIKVDKFYYVIDGHNRLLAANLSKNNLVPYNIIAKDDELIKGKNITARQFAMQESNILKIHKCETDDFKFTDIYEKYPEFENN